MIPPRKGPSDAPTKTEVWIMPSANPSCFLGELVAISAVEAATVPVKAPSTSRRVTSCQGAVTSALRATVMVAANMARSTIGLRPLRSATMPQIGAAIAITPAPAACTAPDQRAAFSVEPAPISFRKKGMNESRSVKPMIARTCAMQSAYRLRRHEIGDLLVGSD